PTRIAIHLAIASAAVLLALITAASPQETNTDSPVRQSLQPHSVRTSLHNSYDETSVRLSPAVAVQAKAQELPLANAHRRRGDIDAAIADFDRAIKIDPKKIDNLLGRGLAYLEKHDTEQAIRDFTLAIELNPRHAGAIQNRAQAHLAAGDP